MRIRMTACVLMLARALARARPARGGGSTRVGLKVWRDYECEACGKIFRLRDVKNKRHGSAVLLRLPKFCCTAVTEVTEPQSTFFGPDCENKNADHVYVPPTIRGFRVSAARKFKVERLQAQFCRGPGFLLEARCNGLCSLLYLDDTRFVAEFPVFEVLQPRFLSRNRPFL